MHEAEIVRKRKVILIKFNKGQKTIYLAWKLREKEHGISNDAIDKR